MQPFRPILRNPHLLTIVGNFARRTLDLHRFPVQERFFDTGEGNRVLVHSQRPDGPVRGELLAIHGLEGSSNAGYLRSLAQLALENGYAVHRKNMRSCGGTDEMCSSMYHAGLTGDALTILKQLKSETDAPLFLLGFSLGGNVVLKLAGELGEQGREFLAGVVAVSTPIDLAACVRQLSRPQNRIYEWRFLLALKNRIRRRALRTPGVHAVDKLNAVRSVYQFDDAFVAPFFGFGTADNYYATQSCNQFLPSIRVPTLMIQAKDDPMIPFDVYQDARLHSNRNIELLAVEHGGHLGFIAGGAPHFWADRAILEWIAKTRNKLAEKSVSST